MQNQSFFLVLRVLFAGLFFALLAVGAWMFKHQQRLFGVDSSMPSETGSSRTYSKLQAFIVWAHAVLLAAAVALLLH